VTADQDHGTWIAELLQQKRERQLAVLAALHAPRSAEGEPLGEEDEVDERPRDERGRFVSSESPVG
jgi:hypothetical protein